MSERRDIQLGVRDALVYLEDYIGPRNSVEKLCDELMGRILRGETCPLNYGTFPDPRAHERRWYVFSCAYAELWLMLECAETGAQGVVKDPSKEEWSWAFDAMANPKRWLDTSRVTLMKEPTEL